MDGGPPHPSNKNISLLGGAMGPPGPWGPGSLGPWAPGPVGPGSLGPWAPRARGARVPGAMGPPGPWGPGAHGGSEIRMVGTLSEIF